MRASAQPVAIVTTLIAESSTRQKKSSQLVHGATLSSFTSVSLDPPLVAFSLRTPSRLADALVSSKPDVDTPPSAHFIISVLSDTQQAIAKAFATPGMEPYDSTGTTSPQGEGVHPLETNETVKSQFAQGVPYLADSVAAFACRVTGYLDLRKEIKDITWHAKDAASDSSIGDAFAGSRTPAGSVLFLAEIMGVDKVTGEKGGRGPLVYWQRRFVRTQE